MNNADWTMTNTGTGMRFTSTTPISGNGRSRVAIKVRANVAGAEANFTTNVSPGSGGESNSANNIAVLALSIQN